MVLSSAGKKKGEEGGRTTVLWKEFYYLSMMRGQTPNQARTAPKESLQGKEGRDPERRVSREEGSHNHGRVVGKYGLIGGHEEKICKRERGGGGEINEPNKLVVGALEY